MTYEPILLGLLGVISHSLIKLNSLRTDAIKANMAFDWKKDYLYLDFLGIILSLLSVFVWYFIFGEWVAKYPTLEGFTLTSFFVMGFVGSYALQLALSRSKKKIREVIDQKTDIADKVTNKTE